MFPVLIPCTANVKPPKVLYTSQQPLHNEQKISVRFWEQQTFDYIKKSEQDKALRDYTKTHNTSVLQLGSVLVPLNSGLFSINDIHRDGSGLYFDKDANTYTPVFKNKNVQLTEVPTEKTNSVGFGSVVDFTEAVLNSILANIDVPFVFQNQIIDNFRIISTAPKYNPSARYVIKVEDNWYLIAKGEVTHLSKDIFTIKNNKVHKTEPVHLVDPSEWKTLDEVNPRNLTADPVTLLNNASIVVTDRFFYYSNNTNNLTSSSANTYHNFITVKVVSPYELTDPKFGKYVLDLLNLEYDVIEKLAFNNGVVDTSCLKGDKNFALVTTSAIVFDDEAIQKLGKTVKRKNMVIKLSDEKKLTRNHCELLTSDSMHWNIRHQLMDIYGAWLDKKNPVKEESESKKGRFFRRDWHSNIEVNDDFVEFIHEITKHVSIKIPVATPRIGEDYNNVLSAIQREGHSIAVNSDLVIQNNKIVTGQKAPNLLTYDHDPEHFPF